ncbi:hypothetical protein F443_08767 [Phytophthora nicotianae P1569]|uniref:Uncharacterized protein n=1 Tax=Phytophthora nicotianae P1569 TaxID=1317065 RepID=V9F5W0_PHYNI|nr:hypothetical protein F443_08767 [Phytophthora nicotianae P1569]
MINNNWSRPSYVTKHMQPVTNVIIFDVTKIVPDLLISSAAGGTKCPSNVGHPSSDKLSLTQQKKSLLHTWDSHWFILASNRMKP